jgi:hypothetical protein
VRPKPERFLIDKVLILLGLGVLLYLGIYINYFLLDKSIPDYLTWVVIICIFLLCVLELILCYLKYSNYSYSFYEQKVIIVKHVTTQVSYFDIKKLSYSVNFIDKLFKTGSIVLELKNGKKIILKYLDNPNQAYFLMQKNVKIEPSKY